MTPEAKARQTIDQKLEQAGWVVQDMQQLDLSAGPGVAVREYPTDSGPADYLLFVDRQAAGVIEAKRDSAGENLTVTERQTERYATANLKWRQNDAPLRFLFEGTGAGKTFTATTAVYSACGTSMKDASRPRSTAAEERGRHQERRRPVFHPAPADRGHGGLRAARAAEDHRRSGLRHRRFLPGCLQLADAAGCRAGQTPEGIPARPNAARRSASSTTTMTR